MTTLAKKAEFTDYSTGCFEALLDNLPLGVLLSNESGKIWYANAFCNQTFGKGLTQEVIGNKLYQLEWVKKSGLENELVNLIQNDQPFLKESIRIKNLDGEELKIKIEATSLKNEKGETKAFVCFMEDVSEKEKLQRNLTDKSHEFTIINEVSLALSSTLNTDQILEMILIGVTAGQGLGFNRAFLLLVDDKGKYLVGKMAIGASKPEEAARIWDELSKKKLTFKEVLEFSVISASQRDLEVKGIIGNLRISMEDNENILVKAVKDRNPVHFRSVQNLNHQSNKSLFDLLGTQEFAVAPLISKDKVLGVIIADNLITSKPIKDEDIKLLQIFANQASTAIENSKLYNQLACQVKKLEEVNLALAENTKRMIMIEKFSIIGQLTARVAHQLRNPMTIIGGFARSLLKKTEESDAGYNSLKIIAGQIDRMEKILNQLLDYTPKPRMLLKVTHLNLTIEQSLKMVEEEINQSGINLIKYLEEELPDFLVDAEQLQVALVNIFRNSIQAMPSGGQLSVATWVDGDQTKIEIKDTGTGIGEDDLKHIFDPFYTTRENFDGLGLTMTSEIIRNHNGQIWAKSQKEKGTSVFISLPVKEVKTDEKNISCR
ncbi:MAG: ATP-binding protein [Candidatus Zixiibacteriota bacterium]